MTRIRRSDAQLDAEAQGHRLSEVPEYWACPKHPTHADISVVELIDEHRDHLRTELSLPRLHVGDGEYGIGMPFAAPFEYYIGWERREQAEGRRPSHPGILFPWSSARWAQWAECRRSHPEHHDRSEWRGSLCSGLITWTVINRSSNGTYYTLTDACAVLGVTSDRAGRTLRNSLLWIERRMDAVREREEQRQRSQTPYEPWEPPKVAEHHIVDGLHREECMHPECVRRRAA